jgi:hypothetical protein
MTNNDAFVSNFNAYIKKNKKKCAFYRERVFSKQWEGKNIGSLPAFQVVWGNAEDMQLPYDAWENLMIERIRKLHGDLLADGTLEGW